MQRAMEKGLIQNKDTEWNLFKSSDASSGNESDI